MNSALGPLTERTVFISAILGYFFLSGFSNSPILSVFYLPGTLKVPGPPLMLSNTVFIASFFILKIISIISEVKTWFLVQKFELENFTDCFNALKQVD